jgi:hypothetical protein
MPLDLASTAPRVRHLCLSLLCTFSAPSASLTFDVVGCAPVLPPLPAPAPPQVVLLC